jgi:hypothetical protein
MVDLREAIHVVVDRLADSGELADDWTRDHAIDWIWSRTHIDVWSQLAVDRKWKPDQVVKRVTASLWSDLVNGVDRLSGSP